jgi:hypothetical protein
LPSVRLLFAFCLPSVCLLFAFCLPSVCLQLTERRSLHHTITASKGRLGPPRAHAKAAASREFQPL